MATILSLMLMYAFSYKCIGLPLTAVTMVSPHH